MALPTSGPLTLADIQTEFGGSNPISLSEYYAGGGLVPAGTTGTNGAVPSSGTISISNFYGTSNVVVSFESYGLVDLAFSPNDAYCYYQINSNGNVYGTTLGVPFDLLEQWISPTSAASGYEVYATLSSGTLTYGTLNTWLPMTASQEWYVAETGNVGSTIASLAFQVRKTGTTTVLDTWTVDLEATVEF
jgi:hypothetical protein